MRFENRKYPHNKWYEIEVQPGPDDTYRLYTSWGPIGSTMTKHKRSWRRTKLHIKPRKQRKSHLG